MKRNSNIGGGWNYPYWKGWLNFLIKKLICARKKKEQPRLTLPPNCTLYTVPYFSDQRPMYGKKKYDAYCLVISYPATCWQLRPVLIVLELAPLTPIEIRKKDNKTARKFKCYATSLDPPTLVGKGGRQDGASGAWKRNFFSRPPHPPCR